MAVTHMQIARAAGVSQSSVSRALTGSVKINCEKAAYIRKIAEEMGYFDERRQKKHEIYGSIYPKIAIFVPELSGWYYTTYIQAMQDAIERIGGFMSVYVVGFEPVRARMIVEQLLHNDRIDCAVSILSNHLELDESTHIPFIQMLPQTSFAEQSLTAVIRMLRDKKHHAIGFIGEKNTFAKLDAFRYSMEQASLPVDESLIYTSDYRFEQIGHDGIRAFCIRGVMPTAIVCAYDEVAFGAVTELRAKGYRVPEDVSVVGYNNIPFCAYFDPPLTSVDEKVEERAQEALQLLQDVLIDKSRIHEPLIVPYHNTLVDAVNVFTTGCDVQKIIKDNNGIPIFNVNNEHTANVLDKILPMFSNRNYTVEPMTWKGDVPGDIWYIGYDMFYAGHVLFATICLHQLSDMSEKCEEDYRILPVPKYDEAQSGYYSIVDNYGMMFAIPISCQNPDFSGFMLEALSAASTDTSLKAYYEISCKTKYTYDEDSAKMLDLVFNGMRYDLAAIYNINGMSGIFESLIDKPNQNIASRYAAVEKSAKKDLDTLVADLTK